MTAPTKADLQSAVARLTEENAALRDLLAAIHEGALPLPRTHEGYPARTSMAARRHDQAMYAADIPDSWPADLIRRDAGRLREKWASQPLTYTALCPKNVDGQAASVEVNGKTFTVPAPCFLAEGHDGECRTLGQIRAGAKPEPARRVRDGEKCCRAYGPSGVSTPWACTAQDGHSGDHAAYRADGTAYATWPRGTEIDYDPADAARDIAPPTAAEVAASHQAARS